jgi:chromate reductase
MIKILGIAGSLRKDSFNLKTLHAAKACLPVGVELEICTLHHIPLFNQDEEDTPSFELSEFKRKISQADAILFSSAEYNYSIPGVLKNAIDCASRPYGQSVWRGKPAAIIGASVGLLGTARMQYHLRQVLGSQNMPVVNSPEVMIGNAHNAFDEQGYFKNAETANLVSKLLLALVELVNKNK